MTSFLRFLSIFSLVLALAAPAVLPAVARAQSEGQVTEPLVIIRFNQANVYYAQQLHGAISKAVEVKPEVMIDVISYAPVTGIIENDRKWQAIAGRNTKNVITAMTEMGVPVNRITVKGEKRSGIKFDETHIFVR